MRKFNIVILLIILFVLLVPCSHADEELIYNGDFEISSEEAQLPSGWQLEAYYSSSDSLSYGISTDETVGSFFYLNNVKNNDARIYQEIKVEPEHVYLISALIKTENVSGGIGATVGVDNYSIDGTYCYSHSVAGSTEWDEVQIFVRTGSEQKALRVCARLGGYSMEAKGTACFSGISAVDAEEYSLDDVIDIMKETGVSSGTYTQSTDSVSGSDDNTLIKTSVLSAFFLIIGVFSYIARFRYNDASVIDTNNARYRFAAIIVVAFAVRVVLSLVFYGHPTDINCFMAWGNAMLKQGPSQFYTSGMFADYPPGYMYILWLLAGIAELFGFSYGSPGYVLIFKMPSIIADLISCYVILKLARKNGFQNVAALILAGLFALNPVISFVSGAWGQIDSLLALGLIICFILLEKGKPISCGFVYGLIILIKPQALMVGPVLAIAYFFNSTDVPVKRRIGISCVSVIAALLSIFVLSLPFKGTQGWSWLIEKYVSTTGSYAYASVEAFNFMALLGGNWANASETVFGIPYKTLGTVFIIISVIISAYLYLKSYKKHRGALYLSAAVLIVSVFTFGHYMHERYMIPALLMIMIAFLYEKDRRLLLCYILLSCVLFSNVTAAMYIVDHQQCRGNLYDAITFISSLAEVTAASYFIYVAFRISVFNECKPLSHKTKIANENCKQQIFETYKSPDKLVFSKKEIMVVGLITLIYAVIAFLNLGTLKAPETYWETENIGETVTITFDGVKNIKQIWLYCNIGSPYSDNCGAVVFSNGKDEILYYEQAYDNMFRWDARDCDFSTDGVDITLYNGIVQINEIAFIDAYGKPVHASVVNSTGSQDFLLDEQDTVPDHPSYFNGMYFDELYHARTAYEHLHNLRPYENSHPPLGKILIMLGIAIFGMCPFGWRFTGTLFGVLMLPLIYLFGKRLFQNKKLSIVLMIAFAFDYMHFTQTRIATIDVYGVFFILLMFYFMYQYISLNFYYESFSSTLKPLALSGISFGIGISCKWICFYAGAGLAILFFYSLVSRFIEFRRATKRGSGEEKELVKTFPRKCILTLCWCLIFFVIIPFLIYYLSYIPYYKYSASVDPDYRISDTFQTMWKYQDFMFSYHSGLNATHPYQSSFWQWPFTLKPMWYYHGASVAPDMFSTLTASGNPAVWWVGIICTIILAVLIAVKKIKIDKPALLILVGFISNYLPWFFVTRCTFIYHYFATVPFTIMATVYLLKIAEQKFASLKYIRKLKWIWAIVVVLLFVLLYPGISGFEIPRTVAVILRALPGGKLMYGL